VEKILLSDAMLGAIMGAVLGGVVTGFFSWLLQRNTEIRSKTEQLRALLIKLLEYHEEFDSQIAPIADAAERDEASRKLNVKRQIYLQAADLLTLELRRHVSAAEYITLARDHQWGGGWEEAERCYRKAVPAARSLDSKAWALRALAQFYFLATPKQNLAEGRRQFDKACQLLKHPKDAYAGYLLGLALESWALAEYGNGEEPAGDRLLEQAREAYQRWPHDALCQSCLVALDKKAAQARRQQPPPPPPPGQLHPPAEPPPAG
jgi:hypothetical protein